MNRFSEQCWCKLLLDVANLFINAPSHGYDPRKWLHEIHSNIKQIHVVGYSSAATIIRLQFKLIEVVVKYSNVEAVTFERADRLIELDEIKTELKRLDTLHVRSENSQLEKPHS